MLWLAIQLVGSALLIAAGMRAIRRSRPLATALTATALLLILLKAAVGHFPAGEPRLFPWNWYPLVEGWWFLFPAMFIFGVAIVLTWKSIWKRDGLLAGAGFLVIYCGTIAVTTTRPHQLTGVVNDQGICHQTSGYSCAPASAVMLLHCYGVASTEQEMAGLCATKSGATRMAGTSDSGILRGLRLKLGTRATPVITVPVYERIPVPSLVAIQLTPSLCHCILVSAVEPDQVRVLDPLYGKGSIPRAQFERTWCKAAISVRESP
jgi:predicted double-glycine peptidase